MAVAARIRFAVDIVEIFICFDVSSGIRVQDFPVWRVKRSCQNALRVQTLRMIFTSANYCDSEWQKLRTICFQ